MKTIVRKSIIIAGLVLAGAAASAQTNSSFFLDNYVYKYRLNPALMPEKSFFGLGVGSINAGLDSDLGLSTFLYPSADGQGLVTGFNNSVSSEDFLSKIGDNNLIGFNLDENLITVGKRRERTLSTLEINIRANGMANLSGDLFRFLKNGPENGSIDLSSTGVNVDSYLELAYGRARQNKKGTFTFGYRLKFLAGIGALDLNLNNTNVILNGQNAAVNLNAQGRLACKPLSFSLEDDKLAYSFVPSSIAPCGYGGAVDLGIAWTLFNRLTLSASISDLGLMSWNYNNQLVSNGAVEFNGFDLSETTDINSEIDALGEQFKGLLNLKQVDIDENSLEMLPFTVRAGARLRMPLLEFLTLGGQASYHHDLVPTWDARVGATATIFRILSLSANCGNSSYGNVCGAALSLTFMFLNLYVSADAYSGPIGLYSGPVGGTNMNIPYPVDNFRYKLNIGLTMQFGKRYKRY
ncbi:MAG: DUF5723 family protein [Candidatus Cryptobacteroides sp.]